jgi:hypothetical protein
MSPPTEFADASIQQGSAVLCAERAWSRRDLVVERRGGDDV